ncbi:MAG: hypothetical protein ABIX01_05330 [Chitinophagaceae bacterium]
MDREANPKEIPDHIINSINSLLRILYYLLAMWWLFLIVGIFGGLAGFYYAYKQKTKYESRLTFALDDGSNGAGMSGAAAIAAQFGISAGGGNDVFAGDNIIQIIKSRKIIESILLSVDSVGVTNGTMIEEYLEFSGARESMNKNTRLKNVHFPIGLERTNFSMLQDSILYNVYTYFSKGLISIERPDKKLNLFELKVLSENERFTKIFTDRLVDEANVFYRQIRSKKSEQTLAVLEQRIATLKGGVNSSIDKRASTQDANLNPAYAKAQVPIQQQQVNIQVYSTAYAEMFKNLEIARYQYLNEMPLMQIIDNANYPMLKIKKGKLNTAIIGALLASFLLTFFLLTRYYVVLYIRQVRIKK